MDARFVMASGSEAYDVDDRTWDDHGGEARPEDGDDCTDFSDLMAALDRLQVEVPSSGNGPKNEKRIFDRSEEASQRMAASELAHGAMECISDPQHARWSSLSASESFTDTAAGPVLPPFGITIEGADSNSLQQQSSKIDEHVRGLMEKLKGDEEATMPHGDVRQTPIDGIEVDPPGLQSGDPRGEGGGCFIASETAGTRGVQSRAHKRNSERHGKGRADHWEGESYEEEKVLVFPGRPTVDRGFLKFMKQLRVFPDQCIRFGSRETRTRDKRRAHMAEPDILWPCSELPRPSPCTCCGSMRQFAFQIMAPTIAALEETAEWLQKDSMAFQSTTASIATPPLSWDWITVAVFACSMGCWGAERGKVSENQRDSVAADDMGNCFGEWCEEQLFVAKE